MERKEMAAAKTASADLDVAEYGSPEHTAAGEALWAALGSAHREQLHQLMIIPTWDGNVISKSARDDLLSLGLAVRCCVNGRQGYTAASYKAFTVLDIAKDRRYV